MRAPPRRAAGQPQKKWLRKDDDDTWETRIGVDGNRQQNFRGENSKFNEAINQVSIFRDGIGIGVNAITQRSSLLQSANLKGSSTNSNILYGLQYEESDTLQIEERKRRRGDSGGLGQGDTEMGFDNIGPQDQTNNIGADISGMDLAAPTGPVLAELAMQAS